MAAVLSAVLLAAALGPMAAPPASLEDCPELIVTTFGARAAEACAVAWCESTYDPLATGAAGERGWFQIHPVHGWRSSYDPAVNVQTAYAMSRGGTDWSQWSCRPWV